MYETCRKNPAERQPQEFAQDEIQWLSETRRLQYGKVYAWLLVLSTHVMHNDTSGFIDGS